MAPWARRGSVRSCRNWVWPVTFSAPSRFGVPLPMTRKPTAVAPEAIAAGLAGRGHPRHLRRPPLGAGHEAGAVAAERLGLPLDARHRRLDVEGLDHRLRGVLGRVHEDLEAVALRVGEVDRPRVAVGDDAELLDALLAGPRVHGLEVG